MKIWNLLRKLRSNVSSKRPKRVRLELEALETRALLSATASGVVTGFVFIDHNRNGIYDTGESKLPGIAVNLNGSSTQGLTFNTTVVTAADGSFNFENVLPGTYNVSIAPANGLVGGAATLGDLTSTSGIGITGSQSSSQSYGYLGLAPSAISLRQFLTTTTNASYASTLGNTPGSGTVNVNYRPNNAPISLKAIPNVAVAENSSATNINLVPYFTDPDITNSEVTLNIPGHPLNVTLFDTATPIAVQNFFDYINSGRYNNAIFSRLVSGFALQGGGATLGTNSSGQTTLNAIATNPAIQGEFGVSNTTGTLAFALSGGSSGTDPNSGTDQFFFNLTNNNASGTTNLDAQKFTVFGQVASATDQTTLNTLATTPTTDESTSATAAALPTVNLANVPLNNYSGTNFPTDTSASNYLVINSVTTDRRDEFLTYSVVNNTNPNLVTTTLTAENLSLSYAPGETGSSSVTIEATDRYGATVQTTFTVTVNATAGPWSSLSRLERTTPRLPRSSPQRLLPRIRKAPR